MITKLPCLVIEKITDLLPICSVKSLRLVCKKFENLLTRKSVMQRLKFFISESVESMDLGHFSTFLKLMDEGLNQRLEIPLIRLKSVSCLSEILGACKHLSEYSGSIQDLNFISNSCKYVSRLTLHLEEDPKRRHREFACNTNSLDEIAFLRRFEYLVSLNITANDHCPTLIVPISIINNVLSHAFSLMNLSFSRIWFEVGNSLEHLSTTDFEGDWFWTFNVTSNTVKNWSFTEVSTVSILEGLGKYKILLPSAVSSLRLISSSDILWNFNCEELQKLYIDGSQCNKYIRNFNMKCQTYACVKFYIDSSFHMAPNLLTLSLLNCDNVHHILRHVAINSPHLRELVILCSRGVQCMDPFCARTFTISTVDISAIIVSFEELKLLKLGGFSRVLIKELVTDLAKRKVSIQRMIAEDSYQRYDTDVTDFQLDLYEITKKFNTNFKIVITNNGKSVLEAYSYQLFYTPAFDDRRHHLKHCKCTLCKQHAHDCNLGPHAPCILSN